MFDSREIKVPHKSEEKIGNRELLNSTDEADREARERELAAYKDRDEADRQAREDELRVLHASDEAESEARRRELDEAYARAEQEKRDLMN